MRKPMQGYKSASIIDLVIVVTDPGAKTKNWRLLITVSLLIHIPGHHLFTCYMYTYNYKKLTPVFYIDGTIYV